MLRTPKAQVPFSPRPRPSGHARTPGLSQFTLIHLTAHRKNVALVCILYLWGDGMLKLVSKTPPLHQGTLPGAMVTADAYLIQAVNGSPSPFSSFAEMLKPLYETAGPSVYLSC